MKSLLLIAHGSRRAQSNEEVLNLVTALKKAIPASDYQEIRGAFLELAEPDIPSSIDACVVAGANEIQILPYFLSAGRHVSADIPEFVAAAKLRHPQIKIKTLTHLGAMPQLADLLTQLLIKQ